MRLVVLSLLLVLLPWLASLAQASCQTSISRVLVALSSTLSVRLSTLPARAWPVSSLMK